MTTRTRTLLALLMAAPALAQDLRKVELRTIDTQKAVKAEKQKAAATRLGPAKAELTRETRARKIEAKEREMSGKRLEMIRLIDEMIAGNPRYAGRYDRLFQRAELEWEEAKYQELSARKAYEDALDRGEKPAEPAPDYTAPIATYQQIRTENPQYDKIDEVRFRLAYALEGMSNHMDALDAFAELVRESAASTLAPDAYLAMGEIWFELGKLVPSRENYKSVTDKFPRHGLAGYARYKLAWTYVNEAAYVDAAQILQQIVDIGGTHGRINLRDQALSDLIGVFAELPDGVRRAHAYYPKVLDKARGREFMLRLARYYDAQDKIEETLQVIALLQADAPTLPDLPKVHGFRVEVLKRTGNLGRLDVELAELAAFYELGSPWDGANAGAVEARAEAQLLLEESLEYLAIRKHEEAQRLKDEAKYREAAEKYADFLKRFPKSKRALRVRFFYGETLLKGIQYELAARQYREVVRAGPSEFYEDAAYKTLFGFAEAMKEKGLDPEAKIIDEKEEIAQTMLAPIEVEFVAASDDFATRFPQSTDAPAVLFKAAKTYYLHGELELAAARFTKIIELAPTHKYAAFAGTLALDCYNRRRDWPNMVKWARYLLQHKNFEHKSQVELKDVVARASVNAVEILEKEGRHAEAAEATMAVVEEFPKSESTDRNLFNAAALYERAGDRKKAEELYDRTRRDFPKGEWAAKATFVLGSMAEARADFPKAAKEYEAVASLPKVERTADALYNAALLHEALGRFDAAIAARRRYVEMNAAAKDAHEVFFAVGPLLERQGRKKEATAHYDEYLKRWPELELVRTLEAHLRAGRLDQVIALFKEKKQAPATPAAAHAAEARFLQAEAIYAEFEAVTLNVPETKIKQAVLAKKAKMELAVKGYVEVVQYQDPLWSAAALYKIGSSFQRFAESLIEAPIPPGLTPDEEEVYRAILQENALPIEEQAIEKFQRAVDLAHKQRIYNKWTALSGQHLAKYRPDAYPTSDRPTVMAVHEAE
ncbi:MAG: tetratricopeptide repeat protein [Myxococcota bacterium]